MQIMMKPGQILNACATIKVKQLSVNDMMTG